MPAEAVPDPVMNNGVAEGDAYPRSTQLLDVIVYHVVRG